MMYAILILSLFINILFMISYMGMKREIKDLEYDIESYQELLKFADKQIKRESSKS